MTEIVTFLRVFHFLMFGENIWFVFPLLVFVLSQADRWDGCSINWSQRFGFFNQRKKLESRYKSKFLLLTEIKIYFFPAGVRSRSGHREQLEAACRASYRHFRCRWRGCPGSRHRHEDGRGGEATRRRQDSVGRSHVLRRGHGSSCQSQHHPERSGKQSSMLIECFCFLVLPSATISSHLKKKGCSLWYLKYWITVKGCSA